MPDLNFRKNKHLTQDDRDEIRSGLDRGLSFKTIAKIIGKDQTTVSKEVKKHMAARTGAIRQDFDEICPNLVRATFVCNPCRKRHGSCGFARRYYDPKRAQTEYKSLLTEARQGIPLNKEEFYENDRVVAEGVKKGQHIYHIIQTHALSASKSTIYRHIKLGYMSISPIDLPRAVKFKPRRAHREASIPKALKIGRTHADFLAYILENDVSNWVEMDTVIGRVGGKTIMTFDFTFCNFMFGLLLDDKTSAEASGKIKALKKTFSDAAVRFGDVFPALLTDNGGEFADVFSFENDGSGERETIMFFCDPQQSSQKPRVEKNHTLLRDIAPSGTSFDNFTQETVNLIFSHVNGVKRKSLGGKSPYDVFAFTHGAELASLLGISFIAPEGVVQSPLLLRVAK